MLADEGDFLEALVASERVAEWTEQACSSGRADARARAAAALADAATGSAAYAEEAAAAEAPTALRAAAAAASDDPQLAAALRAAADACDAAAARHAADEVVTFALTGGAPSLRLHAGARLADGLGGRVWGAAPLLCAALAETPALRGACVLELGAGTGVCGLAAAALGAAAVTLTDAAPAQLAQLTANAALNASSCAGAVRVRLLDWDAEGAAAAPQADSTLPPALDEDERFELVIASDVLYEAAHAAGVARALVARLARSAAARGLLVCPVRSEATAAAFVRRAAAAGLDVVRTPLEDAPGAERYEGGFARFDVRWAGVQG